MPAQPGIQEGLCEYRPKESADSEKSVKQIEIESSSFGIEIRYVCVQRDIQHSRRGSKGEKEQQQYRIDGSGSNGQQPDAVEEKQKADEFEFGQTIDQDPCHKDDEKTANTVETEDETTPGESEGVAADQDRHEGAYHSYREAVGDHKEKQAARENPFSVQRLLL